MLVRRRNIEDVDVPLLFAFTDGGKLC